MAGVLFRERTAELDAWLARRQADGLDRFDEVWEGMYVVVPAPHPRHAAVAGQLTALLAGPAERAGLVVGTGVNVGTPDDFRIPDVTVFDPVLTETQQAYVDAVHVAVDVRSPGEDLAAKLGFYLARGVTEVVLVDPGEQTIRWLAAAGDRWDEVDRSAVLDVVAADVAAATRWP